MIYPTNSYPDPCTVAVLQDVLGCKETESEYMAGVTYTLDTLRPAFTKGELYIIFTLLDFNYAIRPCLTPKQHELAKCYQQANHDFARVVKSTVNQLCPNIREGGKLKFYLSQVPRTITGNFVAWELVRIFLHNNGVDLGNLIESQALTNENQDATGGYGRFMPREYFGWEEFLR